MAQGFPLRCLDASSKHALLSEKASFGECGSTDRLDAQFGPTAPFVESVSVSVSVSLDATHQFDCLAKDRGSNPASSSKLAHVHCSARHAIGIKLNQMLVSTPNQTDRAQPDPSEQG
jgi:hypothetical protein